MKGDLDKVLQGFKKRINKLSDKISDSGHVCVAFIDDRDELNRVRDANGNLLKEVTSVGLLAPLPYSSEEDWLRAVKQQQEDLKNKERLWRDGYGKERKDRTSSL
ncbi:MAG: hypothetical protein HN921_15640 [Bacteroidetes bacterium]|nr:hypothetical protein [Bacteroidota bacterium]